MKIHGGAYQTSGIPDLLLLRHGRAAFIEVKQPGRGKKSEPTPIQRARMEEIERCGGVPCFCATSKEEAMMFLAGLDR